MIDPRSTPAIPNSATRGLTLGSVEPLVSVATLRPGAQVTATVLAQSGGTRALLALGPRTVEVRTTAPLTVGEKLHLEVTHAGRLLVLARRDPPLSAAVRAREALHSQVRDQLQRQLPVQRGLGELLSVLGGLERTPMGSSQEVLHSAAQRFRRQLPSRADVATADGLARALAWATNRPHPTALAGGITKDLLALLRAATPARGSFAMTGRGATNTASPPPPLPGARPVLQARTGAAAVPTSGSSGSVVIEHALGVFARQELLALAGALPRERERAVRGAEIPVRTEDGNSVDVLAIRLAQLPAQARAHDPHRDAPSSTAGVGDEGHRWQVELAFDLPSLGAVRASVGLSATRAVTVHLQADDPATNRRLAEALGELTDGLRGRALEVAGVMAAAEDATTTLPMTRILDEHA